MKIMARTSSLVGTVTVVLALAALLSTEAVAQNWGGGYYNRAVGGISIDAQGMVQNIAPDQLGHLTKMWSKALGGLPIEVDTFSPMRKVSLRGLEAVLRDCIEQNKQVPDEVVYLAGLQRIRYVFVYPEEQDIVLVGPAEGWMVHPKGMVVGVKSGRPVMLLDDLIVALRSARDAAQGGMSCSIEPSAEGLARLQQFVATLRTIGNPQQTAASIEQVLGPQRVLINGVPPESHFARVLLAADYRMKRIAMDLEPSPIKGLPSFMHMVSATGRGMSNMLPRWWLEPNYQPLLRGQGGLAWELRGASVRALTEEDYLAANGNKERTGKASPAAQRWAEIFTEKYDDLALAEPVFGELQNCMDLAIVAALIVKENLMEKANYRLPVLLDPQVKTSTGPAPKSLATVARVMKKGTNWVISASGGVLIQPWAIADNTQPSDEPDKLRAKTSPQGKKAWYWN